MNFNVKYNLIENAFVSKYTFNIIIPIYLIR